MILRLILFNLFVIGFTETSFAQGKMIFTEESFDFGDVKEGVAAVHEFEFINKGNEPIVISNVQASCGCTTPFWTKQPVPPGGKGVIKASFDSKGRMGVFNKSITVSSNAETSSRILSIRGIVIEKPLISPSSRAVFETTTFNLGKVTKGRGIVKNIKVTNEGNLPLDIQAIKSICNCIQAKNIPDEIEPGQTVEVEMSYFPKQTGMFSEPIIFTTNDKNRPDTRIMFRAEVEEDKSLNSVVKESNSNIPF